MSLSKLGVPSALTKPNISIGDDRRDQQGQSHDVPEAGCVLYVLVISLHTAGVPYPTLIDQIAHTPYEEPEIDEVY